jgi:hypothetical protein
VAILARRVRLGTIITTTIMVRRAILAQQAILV